VLYVNLNVVPVGGKVSVVDTGMKLDVDVDVVALQEFI
jgi:hypothetical protein